MPERHKVFKRNSIGCSVDQAYTAQECLQFLRENEYDFIFLDHDLNAETNNQLNDDEEDGRFVVREIIKNENFKNVPIVIHSLNNAGGNEMKKILQDAGFQSHYIPFAWQKFSKTEQGWAIT